MYSYPYMQQPYYTFFLPPVDYSFYIPQHMNHFQNHFAQNLEVVQIKKCQTKTTDVTVEIPYHHTQRDIALTGDRLLKKDKKIALTYKSYSKKTADKKLAVPRLIEEQKEGRNANSNILRIFFRRIYLKIENGQNLIEQISSKYKLSLSTEDILRWIENFKVDYRNYIRVPSIRKIFKSVGERDEERKIMRVLLKQFLSGEIFSCILTSRKIKKGSVKTNLTAVRNLMKEVLNEV